MVYLVYGSPCSGKSTYIREHMKRGDLICDVDLLYGAISQQNQHDAELYTHEIACKLDRALKDIIRDREGNWGDAYVVSLANTDEKLKKDMETVKADEAVYIDTPFDVCMERTKDRPPYFAWIIQEWFETRNLKGE